MDALASAVADSDPFTILTASFLDDLTAAGYAVHRLAARRVLVRTFARWTQDRHLTVANLNEGHVAAFVAGRSRGRETQKHERGTLRRFVAFLRRRGVLTHRPTSASPVDALVDSYVAYLRTDCGLADNSIAIYGPCAGIPGASGGIGR